MKHDMNKIEQQCALTTVADFDFITVVFIGVAPTSSAIHSILGP
jgi:hypothetical protein